MVRMLLDHGFDVVDPSIEQSTRFELGLTKEAPDLVIKDRDDRQGIIALGPSDLLDRLTEILRESLTDVVVRRGVTSSSRDFEFPSISKSELDGIRRRVAVTISRHHFFKACGGEISSFVDMAESSSGRGHPLQEIQRVFLGLVEPYLPYEGSVVDVNHVKLSGTVLTLGQATILQKEDEGILYRRRIRNSGVYDGLGIERESGDLAVTKTHLEKVYTETGYFSATGIFKGGYVNMGTPVELYPAKIRYVDLEIDVCVLRDGSISILDNDLLHEEAEKETISWELCNTIEERVRELTDLYTSDISRLSSLYEYSMSL